MSKLPGLGLLDDAGAKLNNANKCALTNFACQFNKLRRRVNFVRLKEAYFLGSPGDDLIAPWPTSILGKYNNVATVEQIRDAFTTFNILSMKDTEEYKCDAYGLSTLDARGGLFLYQVPNIAHSCWLVDSIPAGGTTPYAFQNVYSNHVCPLFTTRAAAFATY
uniref:Uncharacterized protein n=1 Tax=Globisporangium ultimum (strain ATCC 200006 / CBS 805.95 / DAOM BR144) TaxID=431595 RepID=K3WY16_GLOUD